MEETPEQVLARLERYAASLRGPGPVAVATLERPPPPPLDTLLPPPARTVTRTRPVVETAAQMLAASSCVLTIIAYEQFNHVVALLFTLILLAAGIVGVARKVPLARWWTLGLLLALVLVRIS